MNSGQKRLPMKQRRLLQTAIVRIRGELMKTFPPHTKLISQMDHMEGGVFTLALHGCGPDGVSHNVTAKIIWNHEYEEWGVSRETTP